MQLSPRVWLRCEGRLHAADASRALAEVWHRQCMQHEQTANAWNNLYTVPFFDWSGGLHWHYHHLTTQLHTGIKWIGLGRPDAALQERSLQCKKLVSAILLPQHFKVSGDLHKESFSPRVTREWGMVQIIQAGIARALRSGGEACWCWFSRGYVMAGVEIIPCPACSSSLVDSSDSFWASSAACANGMAMAWQVLRLLERAHRMRLCPRRLWLVSSSLVQEMHSKVRLRSVPAHGPMIVRVLPGVALPVSLYHSEIVCGHPGDCLWLCHLQ